MINRILLKIRRWRCSDKGHRWKEIKLRIGIELSLDQAAYDVTVKLCLRCAAYEAHYARVWIADTDRVEKAQLQVKSNQDYGVPEMEKEKS